MDHPNVLKLSQFLSWLVTNSLWESFFHVYGFFFVPVFVVLLCFMFYSIDFYCFMFFTWIINYLLKLLQNFYFFKTASKSRRAKANVLNLKKAVVAKNKFRRVLRGVKKGGGKLKKHVKKTSEIQLDHLKDVFDKTNQLK